MTYAHFRFAKCLLQTYRNNWIREKVAYFLRKIQTLRVNNSRILRFQNAKSSGYHFYMNTKICRDFQICISVPLNGVIYILKPRSIKSANVFKERKWIIFFFTVVFCLMIHNIYLKRYCFLTLLPFSTFPLLLIFVLNLKEKFFVRYYIECLEI